MFMGMIGVLVFFFIEAIEMLPTCWGGRKKNEVEYGKEREEEELEREMGSRGRRGD